MTERAFLTMHLYIKCKDDSTYESAKKLLNLEKLDKEIIGTEDIRVCFEPERMMVSLDLMRSEVTLGFDSLLEELWARFHEAGLALEGWLVYEDFDSGEHIRADFSSDGKLQYYSTEWLVDYAPWQIQEMHEYARDKWKDAEKQHVFKKLFY